MCVIFATEIELALAALLFLLALVFKARLLAFLKRESQTHREKNNAEQYEDKDRIVLFHQLRLFKIAYNDFSVLNRSSKIPDISKRRLTPNVVQNHLAVKGSPFDTMRSIGMKTAHSTAASLIKSAIISAVDF